MSDNLRVNLWPPLKRTGTTIVQRTNGDSVSLGLNSGKFITPYSRTLTVAKSGAEYTSIQTAITYAATLTPSATNQICIEICSGLYTEAITMSPYVHLKGKGEKGSVVIYQSGANVITLATNTIIENVTVRTGATGPGDLYCFLDDGSACTATIRDVVLESTYTGASGWYGVMITAASNITLENCYCYNTATAGGTGDNGIISIVSVAATVTIDHCNFYMSGAPGTTSSKSHIGIISPGAAIVNSSFTYYGGDAFCNVHYTEIGTVTHYNDVFNTSYAEQIDPASTVTFAGRTVCRDIIATEGILIKADDGNWYRQTIEVIEGIPTMVMSASLGTEV